jgi:hypothetical protein
VTDHIRPYRVATQDGHGWLLAGLADGGEAYQCFTFPGERYSTVEGLEAAHGRLRPVRSPSDAEVDTLTNAFTAAGQRGITAILDAWVIVTAECPGETLTDRLQHMTAGRPGSWEAAALERLVINGHYGGHTGPSSAQLETLCDLYRTWALGDDNIVEIAETTANLVRSILDKRPGSYSAQRLGAWGNDSHDIANLFEPFTD